MVTIIERIVKRDMTERMSFSATICDPALQRNNTTFERIRGRGSGGVVLMFLECFATSHIYLILSKMVIRLFRFPRESSPVWRAEASIVV
jgi:hypothetical protein